MNETYTALNARGTPFNLTRWYPEGVPKLAKSCFFAGSEELCLVETSGRIRTFSFVSQGFRYVGCCGLETTTKRRIGRASFSFKADLSSSSLHPMARLSLSSNRLQTVGHCSRFSIKHHSGPRPTALHFSFPTTSRPLPPSPPHQSAAAATSSSPLSHRLTLWFPWPLTSARRKQSTSSEPNMTYLVHRRPSPPATTPSSTASKKYGVAIPSQLLFRGTWVHCFFD